LEFPRFGQSGETQGRLEIRESRLPFPDLEGCRLRYARHRLVIRPETRVDGLQLRKGKLDRGRVVAGNLGESDHEIREQRIDIGKALLPGLDGLGHLARGQVTFILEWKNILADLKPGARVHALAIRMAAKGRKP